jgi:LPXTG-motif cell wall-anchored protein
MVCHGDRGQGLTEEWRSAWDPSHRDCWQSRCHASNHPPEGFDFPYGAPPLIGSGTLARHATLADLYTYLAAQMPWQAPGSLPGEEYWQLAAYLARANGVLVSDSDLSPEAAARVLLRSGEVVALAPARPSGASWLFLAGAALLLALLALLYARRKRHRGPV